MFYFFRDQDFKNVCLTKNIFENFENFQNFQKKEKSENVKNQRKINENEKM